jgi:hypothetical protein
MPKERQGQKAIATEAVTDLAIRFFLLLAIGFPLNFLFRWGLDSVLHAGQFHRHTAHLLLYVDDEPRCAIRRSA